MLVFAFVISHWVSVIFYFPHQIAENPWVLLAVWNGLSSVGGFFGAFIGMMYYLKKHKQPVIVYADATIYGLLIGWCFGRAGCSLVHDHPGKVVPEGTLFAVGPWPDGTWRYDLGLLEFMFAVTLMHRRSTCWSKPVQRKRPGWLVGIVVRRLRAVPLLPRLPARRRERARGDPRRPDLRYAGLTTAQWFTHRVLLVGLYLVFVRKPKPRDFDVRARTASGASARRPRRAKAEDDEPDDDEPDDDEPDDDEPDDDEPDRDEPEASSRAPEAPSDDEDEAGEDEPEDRPEA